MVKKMEERHSIWIRVFHWINMIAITMLILTGFYIHAPESFRLFNSMTTARTIHFCMAYLLCFGVVGRMYYMIAANDTKNLIYEPINDTKKLPSMLKYYMFLADDHPYYGKYNPGQKGMYTGVFAMAIIMIITGFILYKPLTFGFMAGWLGGFLVVRIIHYVITWIFVLCILAHVYLDVAEGIPILKSMFTGKIPADFHHGYHEEEM
ncbi:MAG TPA: Ni/Fe-hydrogenase, b-type cytochrome subunit [Syntrophomonadaceae bacterium]|jgi:Ni/Fe-hydrogenase 1 B-type cytochrome subunit|nr:Ni/Fe-hydrogenase, b-type cytochrome subunit [Syntrophomonadaceae bacterium]HRX20922.1 Ni/Fe-hydrogenase, b-type cytochrome subunit [Syntrophomonadaceae bacterium]